MAYFRSDDRDHTICYVEGDPAQHAIAFEVSESADLQAIAAELERAGHPVHAGTAAECEARRVLDFISFKDPTGNAIEIVWRAQDGDAALLPDARRGHHRLQPHRLAHERRARATKSSGRGCSTRAPSDWIGDAPLLRINEVHHTIALFPSTHAACSTSTIRSSRSTT